MKINKKSHRPNFMRGVNLLFKNVFKDVFKNWIQVIILTFLIIISAVGFTVLQTTTTRMKGEYNIAIKEGRLHDAIFEADFASKTSDPDNPLGPDVFNDYGVKGNYNQRVLHEIQETFNSLYPSVYNTFDYIRRETRLFDKKIANENYLFKAIAYGNKSNLTPNGKIPFTPTVDNLIITARGTYVNGQQYDGHLYGGMNIDSTGAATRAAEDDVVIDPIFARQNNLALGDYICPQLDDGKLTCDPTKIDPKTTVPLRIVAFGYTPDFTYPMVDPTTVLPDTKKDALIYVNPQMFGLVWSDADPANDYPMEYWKQYPTNDMMALSSIADKETYYSIKINDPRITPEALNKQMNYYMTLAAGNKGKYIYRIYDQNYRFSPRTSMMNDMTALYTTALTIGLVIILIIAFFIIVLLIRKQITFARQRIATLKSLGYDKLTVIGAYSAYPLTIGIIGGLIGWFIGTAIQNLPVNAFQKFFAMPFGGFNWSGGAFAIAVILITAVLVLITFFTGWFTISGDVLKLYAEQKQTKLVSTIQRTLTKINPRRSFHVRFQIAIFTKSLGRMMITFIALIIGSALITAAIFAPKSLTTMIDKTYKNKDYQGVSHYELPIWNSPLSTYRTYDLSVGNHDDNPFLGQDAINGKIAPYNLLPVHIDPYIVNTDLELAKNNVLMSVIGSGQLQNSNWLLYNKDYIQSMITAENAGLYNDPSVAPFAYITCSIALPDYSSVIAGTMSTYEFALKYAQPDPNEPGKIIWYQIVDTNGVPQKITDRDGNEIAIPSNVNLKAMSAGVCSYEGVLTRSPWFVRERLSSPDLNLQYGIGFGAIPYNPNTDQSAIYFNPIIKKINNHNNIDGNKDSIDGYGINPHNYYVDNNGNPHYLNLTNLYDEHGHNLINNLENYQVDLSNPNAVLPVVINQALAKKLNIKNGDVLTIAPNNDTLQYYNGTRVRNYEPFNVNGTNTSDLDYTSIQKGFGGNSMTQQLRDAFWPNQSTVKVGGDTFDLAIQPYMDSVQSSSGSDLAYKGEHRLYYSNNAQNQTTMGHLIYENKLFTSPITKEQQVQVVGIDEDYGNGKMYTLNEQTHFKNLDNIKDGNGDLVGPKLYAERMLNFDKLRDYLVPIFNLSNLNAPTLNYTAGLYNSYLYGNAYDSSTQTIDFKIVNSWSTSEKLEFYNHLRLFDSLYPVWNAKFTTSTALDDVQSSIGLHQNVGDYTRLTLGGGQEFGPGADLTTMYPQYGYAGLTFDALLSQQLHVIESFVNLITIALYFFLAIAIAICFIIIVFTANMIITENKRLISTMKVLGYRNREITKAILGMYFPVIVVGLGLGILAGWFIYAAVVGMLVGWFVLPIIKTWWLFVIIIAIVLVTYTISLLGGYISLKRTRVLDALQE
ncbi:ABC transporter permease [Spiroplasma sp. DGKH1]|uniref:ABC transporter permease n=1 Tax=Spiroplasma sp. DGKH1 TaxID=3050074 RepID=UPI0034C5B83D